VIDTKPHELSESQRQSLRALAREVMNRLEMRKTNMKLAETNERLNDTLNELRETQGQLEEAQASMNHSINYASRIQRAILPRAEQFQEHFPDSFIWNEPRDGVSGDFYWMHPYRNKTILTVADCTGHGVPGAFMSLIGVNALNDIVAQRGIIEPGTILEELDSQVNQTWNSATEEEAPNDGMDITVCVLDPERGRLQYGAAMRRFYLVRGGEVHKLDGERKAVGGGDEKTFESYTTALQRGDRLYLFSDGIEDQFGGPEMQKFTPRRFRELLLEVQDRPMGQQKAAIQEALRAWQGDLAQTDDILLLGVEI
jgi:serine phosphatase RsbU (regulator of sigma subunit)